MCARDEPTATENVRYWCFILKDKPYPTPPPPSLVRPRVNLLHHLRRKEGLCFLLSSRQVSQKRLFCRTSQVYRRLLKVRRCFSFKKVSFVLFTWNVEFSQTIAFIFFCHQLTSISGQNSSFQEMLSYKSASSTRVDCSCKHFIEKNSSKVNRKTLLLSLFLPSKTSTLSILSILKGQYS